MAERGPGSHKRSKSGLARSLLHRDKYKTEGGEDDRSATNSDVESDTGSPSTSAPKDRGLGSFRSSHYGRLATSLETPTSQPSNISLAEPGRDSAPSPQSMGETIEQSVRKFKLFEILRNGDEAAVAQAVRNTSSTSLASNAEEESSAGSEVSVPLKGTTLLHLATQCAEPNVVEQVLTVAKSIPDSILDVNARDRDGNTPLHLASILGRPAIVRLLLQHNAINDTLLNYQGRSPLDLARTPEIYQQLQLFRSIYTESQIKEVRDLVVNGRYAEVEKLLEDSRVEAVLDVNSGELATQPGTLESGGTLLHQAARNKDLRLIQLLLMHGADPFKRDRNGKLPQDVTKDEKTRNVLKRSPAAAAAQRVIQEKAVLGTNPSPGGGITPGGKEAREMKGYLKKWTNYTSGYKLRWFVLEDGVLSYYKHQDDAGSACRGAINMKITTLHMDPQDKTKFEIQGKASVKYHLKANHAVEAKRWFWALTNAIQWTKDEAKAEHIQNQIQVDKLREAKLGESTAASNGFPLSTTVSRISLQEKTGAPTSVIADEQGSVRSFEGNLTDGEVTRSANEMHTPTVAGDLGDEDEELAETASHMMQSESKDAFTTTARSADLQLSLLAQVAAALQVESLKGSTTLISDPTVTQALSTYESAVQSLQSLVGNLHKISRDRDAYWQDRLGRESDARRMWEDSMVRVVKEQEALEGRIDESEDKRKRTKRLLREVLENTPLPPGGEDVQPVSEDQKGALISDPTAESQGNKDFAIPGRRKSVGFQERRRRRSTIASLTSLSESEDEENEEFFDAVDAGEIEVTQLPPALPSSPPTSPNGDTKAPEDLRETKKAEIASSFKGYEDPVRQRLKLDPDKKPPRSLWSILKSTIGKDMSTLTLPVVLNEPTSFLQRITEDMEFSELLDTAADRLDSTERMLYVAAFAASEYASTIGRVSKPFNPLLGETYEYVRPDKSYRFLAEQVSHHPPVGAAWAESAKWDYFGESKVQSKFKNGTSFDVNPLGTWFLRLRPSTGGTELYTWNKVTSSVTGLITGNPTVDNHGDMNIRNHTTGDQCTLNFKRRGWSENTAYHVKGQVSVPPHGKENKDVRWSIGGKWNSQFLARLTPGEQEEDLDLSSRKLGSDQAFLLWQAAPRPNNIPFNLTPFVVTFQSLPDRLKPLLPPTDTRFRPDQRAMEEGKWDKAADQKNMLEKAQRKRKEARDHKADKEGREHSEPPPKWFEQATCEITGEKYWKATGEYWKVRERVAEGGRWEGVDSIFEESAQNTGSGST